MPTYAVDYTGSDPANRIIETKQLSAANFRNYWVVIPDYAPFYRQGLVVKNATTDAVLVENVHYYLTHEFREASLSIGKNIFGSISFIRSAINFDIKIEYQTIGGSWTISVNDIASILANMVVNPRVTRWTQVHGYPAVFPPINHDVNANPDLFGMAEVVAALNSITVALGQRNATAPIQQPSIVAASIPETIAGLLTNKATTPAGVKAVMDDAKSTLRNEIANSSNTSLSSAENVLATVIGDSFFVNTGYEVSIKTANSVLVNVGDGWFRGKKVPKYGTSELFTSLASPIDVINNIRINSAGVADYQTQYTLPAIAFTNYLTYSDMPQLAGWTAEAGVALTYGEDYNTRNEFTTLKYIANGANRAMRYVNINDLAPGQPMEFSFVCKAFKEGKIFISLGSSTVQCQLYAGKRRYRILLTSDVIPQLSFYAFAYDSSANYTLYLSEMSLVKNIDLTNYNSLSNSLDAGVYTKTNTTVTADDAIIGNFGGVNMYDKILETTTAGNHTVSYLKNVKKGFTYTFRVCVKAAERSRIQLFINGSGFNYSQEQSVIVDLNTTGIYLNQLVQTPIVSTVGATTYASGNVYIEIKAVALADGVGTFGIRTCLTDNSNSYAGVATSGYHIGMFSVMGGNDGTSDNLIYSKTKGVRETNWDVIALNIKNYDRMDNRSNRYTTYLSNKTELWNDPTWSGVGLETTKQYALQLISGYGIASEPYTFSIEVKPDTCTKVQLMCSELATNDVALGYSYATFDLQNVISNPTVDYGVMGVSSATISSLSNGWLRITLSIVKSLATNTRLQWKFNLMDIAGTTVNFNPIANYGLTIAAPKIQVGSTYTTYTESIEETLYDIDYFDAYATPRTKYLTKNTGLNSDYKDNNGNTIIVTPLATAFNNPVNTVIDKRNALMTKEAAIRGMATIYNKAINGDVINPNGKTLCASGQVVYLKPIATLKEGDSYTFVKENGLVVDPTINVSAIDDMMIFYDYNNETTVTESSITYNTQGPLEITVINGKFHVFF